MHDLMRFVLVIVVTLGAVILAFALALILLAVVPSLARFVPVLVRHLWHSWRYGRRVRAGAVPECGALCPDDATTRCVLPQDHAHFTHEKAHAGVWRNNGCRVRWEDGPYGAWVQTRPIAQRVARGGAND